MLLRRDEQRFKQGFSGDMNDSRTPTYRIHYDLLPVAKLHSMGQKAPVVTSNYMGVSINGGTPKMDGL